MTRPVVEVLAQVGTGESTAIRKFIGRQAWTVSALVKAGDRGITAFDNVGPRLSHYVFELRKTGMVIETKDEPHGGPFPGSHGRYVLGTPVKILEERHA